MECTKVFLVRKKSTLLLTDTLFKKYILQNVTSLPTIEVMVLVFYFSKGFGKAKLKAYLDILKNRKHISEKYTELESKKTVTDKELMRNFPD